MAKRIIFEAVDKKPYVKVHEVKFVWNKGLNIKQKRKNISAVHNAFLEEYPDKKILEISSKSMQKCGNELSAFNLKKFVPSLGKELPVENVFQGGKIFDDGTDKPRNAPSLYAESPVAAKRIAGELAEYSKVIGFTFDGQSFPSEPKTAFYDYIYCNALLENPSLAEVVLSYDAFSDIEFNPAKSLNCQARAAAIFAAMHHTGLADLIKDFASFLSFSKEC